MSDRKCIIVVDGKIAQSPVQHSYDDAITEAKRLCEVEKKRAVIYKAVAEVQPKFQAVVSEYGKKEDEMVFKILSPIPPEPHNTHLTRIINDAFKPLPAYHRKCDGVTMTLPYSKGWLTYRLDEIGGVVIHEADIVLNTKELTTQYPRLKVTKFICRSGVGTITEETI
jgi:hypothetical protein